MKAYFKFNDIIVKQKLLSYDLFYITVVFFYYPLYI